MGGMSDFGLPFPIEFIIRDSPRSHQSENKRAKERWRAQVGAEARAHLAASAELCFIDERPLAATILYFSPVLMAGDVDNIVKLIIDGMIGVFYHDDRVIERIVVQKIEPGVVLSFGSVTPTLEHAIGTEPPVIYIRLDDDLSWRQLP